MKKISTWFLMLVLTAGVACGQDAATQQQLDKLSGQIQDLVDARGVEAKRMDALEKEVRDLQDKLNQPVANDSASADDLKKLAAQVQEIDKKRQADNDKILKALEKLAKTGGGGGSSRKAPVLSNDGPTTPPPAAGEKQKGYDYEIHPGDTLSAIAKAYRDQGVKVTTTQIIAANPGLNPNALYAGKKIFIPDPNAK